MATTPNMNLDLPVAGPGGTAGPLYATKNNTAFTDVDSHDHTSGKGVKVPSAGININADLEFNDNSAIELYSAAFTSQGATISGNSRIYVVGGDLYYNNSSGTAVRITNGTALDIASAGGISGDYGVGGSEIQYSDVLKQYSVKQSETVTANLLCGPISIYDNNSGSNFTKLQIDDSTQTSNLTLTLPPSLPTATAPVVLSSAGVLSAGSGLVSGSSSLLNIGLTTSVASNALTIAVKNASGSDASATSPIRVGFRSSTITSGTYNIRELTGALSLTVSSGSTLGHASATNHYIYVYLLDNAGTIKLGVSTVGLYDGRLVTTVSEGGGGSADSNRVVYSDAVYTSVPCRLIGRLKSNQTTAGTWASNMSEIILDNIPKDFIGCHYYINSSSASLINTGTNYYIDYNVKVFDTHNAVLGAGNQAQTTNGTTWRFVVPADGKYGVNARLRMSSEPYSAATILDFGVRLNNVTVAAAAKPMEASVTMSLSLIHI